MTLEIHTRIKTIRKSKNITQQYMADHLFIDPANYGRIERGESKIDSKRLIEIAKILDVDVSCFLNDHFDGFNANSGNTYLKQTQLLEKLLQEITEIKNAINRFTI